MGRAVPMATLAKDLSGVLERPVFDKTMLNGEYDFGLTWTPMKHRAMGWSIPARHRRVQMARRCSQRCRSNSA